MNLDVLEEMDLPAKKSLLATRARDRRRAGGGRPAIGLEAEFTVLVDGQPAKPEDVFGSPRHIVRQKMVHRTGRSYHLPTGGAVYFDTGVIEVATPMVEIEPGCAARAGRSLWEGIEFLRGELDAWEARHGKRVALAGFSAHYNVSFDVPEGERGPHRTVRKLAWLLTHLLPMPVMLLAANRESTGVGVRPRGNRVEVTADFTPDAPLSVAAATLIVAVVRDVMAWPSYEMDELRRRMPSAVVRGFAPIPHSSRKGWVAKHSCYPRNPFQTDPEAPAWETLDGVRRSTREVAGQVVAAFAGAIRHYADPLSRGLIFAAARGRAKTLLHLPRRPESYLDVGRGCRWDDLYTEATLSRSRYERVLLHAIGGAAVTIDGEEYVPTGMRGWSHVKLRRTRDGRREERTLDQMVGVVAGG